MAISNLAKYINIMYFMLVPLQVIATGQTSLPVAGVELPPGLSGAKCYGFDSRQLKGRNMRVQSRPNKPGSWTLRRDDLDFSAGPGVRPTPIPIEKAYTYDASTKQLCEIEATKLPSLDHQNAVIEKSSDRFADFSLIFQKDPRTGKPASPSEAKLVFKGEAVDVPGAYIHRIFDQGKNGYLLVLSFGRHTRGGVVLGPTSYGGPYYLSAIQIESGKTIGSPSTLCMPVESGRIHAYRLASDIFLFASEDNSYVSVLHLNDGDSAAASPATVSSRPAKESKP